MDRACPCAGSVSSRVPAGHREVDWEGAGGPGPQWQVCPEFLAGPHSLCAVSSAGRASPLLCLASTSLTFEDRVMCHSSGKPLLPPCPHHD